LSNNRSLVHRPATGAARASMRSAGEVRCDRESQHRYAFIKAKLEFHYREAGNLRLSPLPGHPSWVKSVVLAAQKRENGPDWYRNLENVGSKLNGSDA
jgi:hypothetical protein